MSGGERRRSDIPLIKEILSDVLIEAARRDRSFQSMYWRIGDVAGEFLADSDWRKFVREWSIYNTQVAFGTKQFCRTAKDWEGYCKKNGLTDEEGYEERVWRTFEQTKQVLAEYGIDVYLMVTTTDDEKDLIVVQVNIYDLIYAVDRDPKKVAEIAGKFLATQAEAEYDSYLRERYKKTVLRFIDLGQWTIVNERWL